MALARLGQAPLLVHTLPYRVQGPRVATKWGADLAWGQGFLEPLPSLNPIP